MSHLPEPLLSHNEESMTEHRKSHPPETSLTSRELAERVMHCGTLELQLDEIEIDRGAALIEAWVREKIAEALEAAAKCRM